MKADCGSNVLQSCSLSSLRAKPAQRGRLSPWLAKNMLEDGRGCDSSAKVILGTPLFRAQSGTPLAVLVTNTLWKEVL